MTEDNNSAHWGFSGVDALYKLTFYLLSRAGVVEEGLRRFIESPEPRSAFDATESGRSPAIAILKVE